MKARLAAVLSVFALACTEAPPQSPHDVGGYRVDVQAPERMAYAPALLGTGPTPMKVVVVNEGAEPLDVSKLSLRFDASGGGVAVHCTEDADPRTSEPGVLAPGARFAFERGVDCRLPLAGPYRVEVFVAFGRDRTWRLVRTYGVDVIAPPGLEPRPLNDSGLLGTIGAAPLAGSADRRGHPRVGLALTNTGGIPIELPPLRVETRATRAGSPWACTSPAVRLSAPPALAAGATHREPFEVGCLGLDVHGQYDVEVMLLVGEDRRVSLGHLRIDVTDDPARVLPAPSPAPPAR